MTKKANSISLKELEQYFYIDNEYRLRWKIKPSAKVYIGDLAGVLTIQNGIRIHIKGKNYQSHRLLYQMYHNLETLNDSIEIDHIDVNRTNNAPNNLRECTSQQNDFNRLKYKDNKVGYKGVFKNKSIKNSYRTRVCFNGVFYNLGSFTNPEDAHIAYCNKAKELHGEFWNPG